ncbi:colicin E3/pyocin S6 family cytotoxin [Streptomyces sp. NPDC002690]
MVAGRYQLLEGRPSGWRPAAPCPACLRPASRRRRSISVDRTSAGPNRGFLFGPAPCSDGLPVEADARSPRGPEAVQEGGGYRPRWSLPDGRILEWDSQHGTIGMWTNGKKNAKQMRGFDPNKGYQLPGNNGKSIRGRALGGVDA